MRILLVSLLFLVTPLSAKAAEGDTLADFFRNLSPTNWAFMKEWSPSHWKGQDYKPTMNPESGVMRHSVTAADSMFANSGAVSPTDFINNLKKARIIKRVYNPEFGLLWDRRPSDDVVVELDHNFYTLSYADKMVVTDMISRAYDRQYYALKDGNTGKIVGQITAEGFHLY